MCSFKYYNANPLGRRVNDCTIRAISLATGRTWDDTYDRLSEFAQTQAITPSEVEYIDGFLEDNFKRVYSSKQEDKITINDFIYHHPKGTYLITMRGHITCAIDGCIYDTFDPRERIIWDVYKI